MGQLNLDKSIKRVLASVHPDLNMSTDAKIIHNNFLNNLMRKIIEHAIFSSKFKEVILRVFKGELAFHTITEIRRSLLKYENGTKTKGIFPYLQIKEIFEDMRLSIAVSAVLNYISGEILELAGNLTREDERLQMSDSDIIEAMTNDPELHRLINKIGFDKKSIKNINEIEFDTEHIMDADYLDFNTKPEESKSKSKRNRRRRSKRSKIRKSRRRRSKRSKSRKSRRRRKSRISKSRRSRKSKSIKSRRRRSKRSKSIKSRRSRKSKRSRRSKSRRSKRSRSRKSRRSKRSRSKKSRRSRRSKSRRSKSRKSKRSKRSKRSRSKKSRISKSRRSRRNISRKSRSRNKNSDIDFMFKQTLKNLKSYIESKGIKVPKLKKADIIDFILDNIDINTGKLK